MKNATQLDVWSITLERKHTHIIVRNTNKCWYTIYHQYQTAVILVQYHVTRTTAYFIISHHKLSQKLGHYHKRDLLLTCLMAMVYLWDLGKSGQYFHFNATFCESHTHFDWNVEHEHCSNRGRSVRLVHIQAQVRRLLLWCVPAPYIPMVILVLEFLRFTHICTVLHNNPPWSNHWKNKFSTVASN